MQPNYRELANALEQLVNDIEPILEKLGDDTDVTNLINSLAEAQSVIQRIE